MNKEADIAVVGMSCIFPGAGNLQKYWENIINKVNAITDAPMNRIDNVFFDPNSSETDRIYVNRGGFIDDFVDFNPVEFGIVPKAVQGMEPDQLLSLKLAFAALEDADVFKKKISLQTAGIIIGKASFGGVELFRLSEIILGAEKLVRTLKYFMPHLQESDLKTIKNTYQKIIGNYGPENVMGTVPNLTASLVANRLDFGGPAYTVDAACASSLIAIDHAVKELNSFRCDLVIAGGIHLGQNPVLWSVFSLLGALSRSQVIRPFDKHADGVLAGEGCGYVVLRRLEDAIRDDQRIYAIIKGVGLSSDGASSSIMSPSSKGQIKAIRNAWGQTNLSTDDIGYIEAHGTATPLGDKVELESLKEIFGHNDKLPRAGIGSIKSMIGHAMPAAGIAGFIKTALAIYHGKLPPTLHCDNPLDAMQQTRFEPVREAIDWDQTGLPRIAGINAFGFGGANAHVILQGFNVTKKTSSNLHCAKGKNNETDKEVIIMARQSAEALIESLKNQDYTLGNGNHRLAIFEPTYERIQKAIDIISKGIIWRNKLDIWYTSKPLLVNQAKLAFIFPGLDAASLSNLKKGNFNEVATYFNLPKPKYYSSDPDIKAALSIDESFRLIDSALKKSNIVPDVMTGHSAGEWTACYAAGMVDIDIVEKLELQAINRTYEKEEVFFLSVGASIEEINPLLKENNEIYLSNDNCPHQIVLCGKLENINKLRVKLNEKQLINNILPFQTGWHSPFAKKHIGAVKKNLDEIVIFKPSKFSIWSGITALPYPKKIEEIKQLHIDFLTKPVLFRELTEKLYDDGVRFFLQIGAGSTLGFINDTLKNKNFASIASGSAKIPVMQQLQRVVAALFVEGKEVDFSLLNLKKNESKKGKQNQLSRKLDLGFNFIDTETVLSVAKIEKLVFTANKHSNGKTNTILDEFNKSFLLFNQTQKEILDLLNKRKQNNPSKAVPEPLTVKPVIEEKIAFVKRIEFSLEKYPELLHHCPFKKRSFTYNFDYDREPVVPLTMFLQIFGEIACEMEPNRIISKFENVNALQFLWVKNTVNVEVHGKWKSADRVFLNIDNYVNAEIVFDDSYVINPEPAITDIGEPTDIPITERQVYDDGYMFHDPFYQGIVSLKAMGSNGISGIITGKEGKGSLLDSAQQLMGVWYHLQNINIMSFPVKIKEIKFYDNFFIQEGNMQCTCILTDSDEEFLFANIELIRKNHLWASIDGLQSRKSEIDTHLWTTIVNTENTFFSTEIEEGVFLCEKKYNRLNSWFFLMNVYLNKSEKRLYESLSLMRRNPWLMGRIAAKDAIRNFLMKNQKFHPAAFTIKSDKTGRPLVEGIQNEPVYISIAHKEEFAVAIASKNQNVGIDIEIIRDKGPNFLNMVLSDEEIKLMPSNCDISEFIIRCWVAKEAYWKSIGKGLNGNPKNYSIEKIDNNKLWINNVCIKIVKIKNFLVGWTQQLITQQ